MLSAICLQADRESEQGGRSVSQISPGDFMMGSVTVGFGAELRALGCDGPSMVATLPETCRARWRQAPQHSMAAGRN